MSHDFVWKGGLRRAFAWTVGAVGATCCLLSASGCGSSPGAADVATGGSREAGGSEGTGSSGGTVGTGGTASTGGQAGKGTGGAGSGGSSGGMVANGGGRTGGRAGGSIGEGGRAAAAGTTGTAGTMATGGSGGSGTTLSTGPCDIYAAGNVPCVAAHSTVRALLGSYTGSLYQVRRASDKTTKDIGVLERGGFANAAEQDTFCASSTCTISVIYDQSGKGNHLKVGPAGGAGKADVEANAAALKLNVSGHPVYAVFVSPGTGYRNNATAGIATGSEAEGLYMVASGKHVNNGCCFDYGNAETNNKDTGNGHMEAIYLGTLCWTKPCNGSGPWVMADLENGLFAGGNGASSTNTSVTDDYVTAMVKGNASSYAIKAGNSQSGALKTMYSGGLPTAKGYNPMHKEGAIILGVGGDNSNASAGTFFEGCMTSGFPSDATEDAVQANIVAAGYGH